MDLGTGAKSAIPKMSRSIDFETVERDLHFDSAVIAIDTLDGRDLEVAAEYIGALSDLELAEAAQTDNERRSFLKLCVKHLRNTDSAAIAPVDNFLDAIGRARLKRSHSNRFSNRPSSVSTVKP